MDGHLRRHMNDEEVECKICGKAVKNLSGHMRNVHYEKKFKCPYDGCDKGFSKKHKFEEHIAIRHTREFLFNCRVPGCGLQFRIQNGRNMHERRMHKEEYARALQENKINYWAEKVPWKPKSTDSQASDSNEVMQVADSANLIQNATVVTENDQMETQMAVEDLQIYGNVVYEEL
jgi:hypothetical protein